MTTDTIFFKSKKGRNKYKVGYTNLPQRNLLDIVPKSLIRKGEIGLPDLNESQVVRHFTSLSRKNYGVDDGIYPLGSCTMKYNPRINEGIAKDPSFMKIHPYQTEDDIQGTLKVMYELGEILKKIVGLDAVTLHPSAGAHGELCGLLMVKKYFDLMNEERNLVIIPDSSHGTNFASASMAGFDVLEVKSGKDGTIDLELLKDLIKKHSRNLAITMITSPNTLGIFEKDILYISQLIHNNGSLLYYDGANLNG